MENKFNYNILKNKEIFNQDKYDYYPKFNFYPNQNYNINKNINFNNDQIKLNKINNLNNLNTNNITKPIQGKKET